MVGTQGNCASPAGDFELVDAAFLVACTPNPEFHFQVRGYPTELQQVFAGTVRREHHPVLVVAREDRTQLRGVFENPDRSIVAVVRLEHIRPPHVQHAFGAGSNLLYAEGVGANIIVIVGFEANFEVPNVGVNFQEHFTCSASGDLEFLDAFFLVPADLDPEFALQTNAYIRHHQQILP